MHIQFTSIDIQNTGTLVIGVYENALSTMPFPQFDEKTHQSIQKAIQLNNFKGKKGESIHINGIVHQQIEHLVIVGLGELLKWPSLQEKPIDYREVGGHVFQTIKKLKTENVTICIPKLGAQTQDDDFPQVLMATGLKLKSWQFDKYFTKNKDKHAIHIKNIYICVENPTQAQKLFNVENEIVEGVFLTRTVVSEVPNVLTPAEMVRQAKELSSLGVKVEILDEQDMRKLGMNALLGVGQGSMQDSYLVVMSWNGGAKDQAPLAVVGKGVTFDTGGISIKPSANMDEMKFDMAGAGAVLGLMRALAGRKASVNVVGVMGMVENMPSGSAQRPGDVVKSMSGQTIEILNTDAEGRLVLADALWYTQDRFKPQYIVDLATLTGAIIVSLGHEHAGLFSNNDTLVNDLKKAASKTGESVWHLPLGAAYDKDIDSTVADVKNIGSGRGAGSITAAQFLKRFVNDVPWAHIDIAGTAWDKKAKPLFQPGASGFGVLLLNEWVKSFETN